MILHWDVCEGDGGVSCCFKGCLGERREDETVIGNGWSKVAKGCFYRGSPSYVA